MDRPTVRDIRLGPLAEESVGPGSGGVEITLREDLPEGMGASPGRDLIRLSPDRRRVAIWEFRNEISMGVGRYEVRWGEAGLPFEELRPVLPDGFDNELLYPPAQGYQPWSWDSGSLLLTFFGHQRKRFGMITFPRRQPVLWDVESGGLTELDFTSDRFVAVLAAPGDPVAVVVSRKNKGNAAFFGLPEGIRRGDFFSLKGWACWQAASGRLLAVAEENRPRKIVVRAYDPASGHKETELDLTRSIMAVVPRWPGTGTRLGGLYLENRNTVLSMAQLDQLQPVIWDESGSCVYLGCWRPSGEPVHESRFGRRAVLPVVRNWIEIRYDRG